ncbi:MAG: PilN domain-containing protein [Rubrivivax sp.]|nr:PilN domain-containing protein [Rubrivivax sp.]
MILINLLPHREAKRQQRKRAFFAALGLSALAGLAVVGVWFTVLQQMTSAQGSRNDFLRGEIARLDAQVKDIATLRAEIEALKARQKSVEDLQTDRNTPVYLLDEVARYTPEGIYLTTIKQTGQSVAINGVAQTNERVSEFLRNVGTATWLERPELLEIKSANITTTGKDQRRLYEFSMRVSLKRPQAATPADAAASGAAAKKAS